MYYRFNTYRLDRRKLKYSFNQFSDTTCKRIESYCHAPGTYETCLHLTPDRTKCSDLPLQDHSSSDGEVLCLEMSSGFVKLFGRNE